MMIDAATHIGNKEGVFVEVQGPQKGYVGRYNPQSIVITWYTQKANYVALPQARQSFLVKCGRNERYIKF